ncbi:MAG: hypothetical protein AAB481_00170, partial [Patescibacteria group bacterium]
YTLKVTGTGKGKYTVVVGQITADNDYWDTIDGEITKDPPSSQTDSYTINYPSNPLFPSSGTGGSTITTSTSTSNPTPTPPAKQDLASPDTRSRGGGTSWIDNVLGVRDNDVATPVAEAVYEIPQPRNPLARFLHWIFVTSGILLLFLAFILSRRKPKVSRR